MRRMSGSVEVQRMLILTCLLWLLAGAYLRDPFWLVVARAAGATAWTLLLGWSFTVDRPGVRVARIALGAGFATGCAVALGASPAAIAAVAAGAASLLVVVEHAVHARVASADEQRGAQTSH